MENIIQELNNIKKYINRAVVPAMIISNTKRAYLIGVWEIYKKIYIFHFACHFNLQAWARFFDFDDIMNCSVTVSLRSDTGSVQFGSSKSLEAKFLFRI